MRHWGNTCSQLNWIMASSTAGYASGILKRLNTYTIRVWGSGSVKTSTILCLQSVSALTWWLSDSAERSCQVRQPTVHKTINEFEFVIYPSFHQIFTFASRLLTIPLIGLGFSKVNKRTKNFQQHYSIKYQFWSTTDRSFEIG